MHPGSFRHRCRLDDTHAEYSGATYSRYIVYHFDINAFRSRSLLVITKPATPASCTTFSQSFFVIGWEEGECFFLHIREFMLSEDEPDKEVLMSLGADVVGYYIFCGSLTLISR